MAAVFVAVLPSLLAAAGLELVTLLPLSGAQEARGAAQLEAILVALNDKAAAAAAADNNHDADGFNFVFNDSQVRHSAEKNLPVWIHRAGAGGAVGGCMRMCHIDLAVSHSQSQCKYKGNCGAEIVVCYHKIVKEEKVSDSTVTVRDCEISLMQ